jgi:hypothetical protein
MTDVQMTWLSTVVTLVTTAAVFVILVEWSAGGPAPWTILPGVVRGVVDWVRREDEFETFHLVSPRAEEAQPPMEPDGLPLTPIPGKVRQPEAWVEEHVDPEVLAEIEIEELDGQTVRGRKRA